MKVTHMRAAAALAILIVTALPAAASEGFDLVIPGRPGVPIIINGIDASYAVVEGEWGLGKGTHVQPTIYGGRLIDPDPHVGHYYPSLGHRPGYGRLEIQPPPNRILPKPAESYDRSWSAQSAPPRAQADIPFNPPPVISATPNSGAGPSPYAAQLQASGFQDPRFQDPRFQDPRFQDPRFQDSGPGDPGRRRP